MARPCGVRFCRLFLVFLNLLFLLCGGAILGLGIWMLVSEGGAAYMQIIHDASCDDCSKAIEYLKVPYVLMGIGGLVALLSFLGCCGAWTESSCFLCLYSLLLLLILLSEVVCAILIGIFKNKITKCIECSMQEQVKHQYNQTDLANIPKQMKNNETSVITLAWDKMQKDLECCGAVSPSDYKQSAWFNYTIQKTNMPVPPSCCSGTRRDPDKPVTESLSCKGEAIQFNRKTLQGEPNFLYTKGCHDAFLEWLKHNVYIAIGVLIGIIILQILDFIAACLLLSRIRTEQMRKPHYHYDD